MKCCDTVKKSLVDKAVHQSVFKSQADVLLAVLSSWNSQHEKFQLLAELNKHKDALLQLTRHLAKCIQGYGAHLIEYDLIFYTVFT